ncbi:MAG: rhomboid family intramembrane serine protease [Gemmatimonadota bacterium]|nr:rhomboid family intramembrane serine protease [Gemmatimonadota bacterium]
MNEVEQGYGSEQEPKEDRFNDPVEPPIKVTPDMLAEEPVVRERDDFEVGMSAAPVVTLAFLAAYVLVFVWELGSGALTDSKSIIAAGALHRNSVEAGEWWRLISATFLHGSVDHLLGNALFFYVLGMACEHAYGARRTLLFYLATGISGSVISIAAEPGPSVGASGVVFGMMGGIVAYFYMHRGRFHRRNMRIAVVLAVWTAYSIATGFLTPYVDNFAHLGGLAGGLILGRWLPEKSA